MSNTASKKTLIIMVAVFVLPVVLAKLALDNDWFTKGATNKGNLLAPTIDMSALLKDAEPKWRLLYVMPETCDRTVLRRWSSLRLQAIKKRSPR